MSQPVRVEIDNITYIIRKFDVFTAIGILASLQKTFVPGIARMFSGTDEAFEQAVSEVSSQLSEAEFDRVYKSLLIKEGNVSFVLDGADPQRLRDDNKGMAFASIDAVFSVIIEVLKVNYADFFSNLMSRFGAGQAQTHQE